MSSSDFKRFSSTPVTAVRDYWNARPCNIRHSPKPPGTREYFDEVEQRKYFVEPHIPRFAEFPRWKNKKVLEIGCGIGTDTMNFARNGASVVAVDYSDQSIAIARQRARVFGLEGSIQFHHGNAEELQDFLPVEQFDLIYSFGVIHHTPHPDRVLEQVKAYGRPGTVVKIMVYHRHSWKVLVILLGHGRGRFWTASELIARHSEAQTGCPVTFTFSRRQARRMMEQRGFILRDLWVDHIFSYRVPDYSQHRYVKAWPFRALPSSAFHALERSFGWHLCIDAEIT